MRKREALLRSILLLLFFAVCAPNAVAQQSYRISEIQRTHYGKPSVNFRLYYQEDGRISKSETNHLSGNYTEYVDFTYDDKNETILMEASSTESGSLDVARSEIKLRNGRILNYASFADYGGKLRKRETVTYYYDEQDRIIKMTEDEEGQISHTECEWFGGNLVKLAYKTSYNDDKIIDYVYSDYPNPESNLLFSPYFEDYDAFYIALPGNYLSNLLGTRSRNLPLRKIKTYVYDGSKSYENYDYKFDEHGNISEIIVTDEEGEYLHFWITYEAYIKTSVPEISIDESSVTGIFNSLGERIMKPEKGINIIRYKDSSVRKVIVK